MVKSQRYGKAYFAKVSPTSRLSKYTIVNPSGEISGALAKSPNNIYGNKLLSVMIPSSVRQMVVG